MNIKEVSSKRAKARWEILRSALLQSNKNSSMANLSCSNGNNVSASAFSIHRFKGFQILNRRVVAHTLQDDTFQDVTEKNEIDHRGENKSNAQHENEFVEYDATVPILHNASSGTITLFIRTREKKILGTANSTSDGVGAKVNLKDLMSHVHYGVDNTGNTRVWDSASVLVHILLCGALNQNTNEVESMPFVGLDRIVSLATPSNAIGNERLLKVVELGAGMAGLASLFLAALDLKVHSLSSASPSLNCVMKSETNIPRVQVTITDGHPSAVHNNSICAALTRAIYTGKNKIKEEILTNDGNCDEETCDESMDDNSTYLQSPTSNIFCHKLLWKDNEEGAKECQSLLEERYHRTNHNSSPSSSSIPLFDLCLVSDCTHFTEFHAALAATIGRLVRVGGVCILCQPHRGKTLTRFIDLIHAVNLGEKTTQSRQKDETCHTGNRIGPLFEVNLWDKYDDKMNTMHRQFLEQNEVENDTSGNFNKNYDPMIHYPVLLVLKKLRDYEELVDTKVAVAFLNSWDCR